MAGSNCSYPLGNLNSSDTIEGSRAESAGFGRLAEAVEKDGRSKNLETPKPIVFWDPSKIETRN